MTGVTTCLQDLSDSQLCLDRTDGHGSEGFSRKNHNVKTINLDA
jgi:hypothetical protein